MVNWQATSASFKYVLFFVIKVDHRVYLYFWTKIAQSKCIEIKIYK